MDTPASPTTTSRAVHPHDFRRLLVTELVGAGLPLHIDASLLGHLSLDTTRGYTAVFPEQVIAAPPSPHRTPPPAAHRQRAALGHQRGMGRVRHLLLRKVTLGDCPRPTGHVAAPPSFFAEVLTTSAEHI